MSRKRSNKDFRVDSLRDIVVNRQKVEAEKNACPNKYLTVMFLGVYDKTVPNDQAAEVSIFLSKISHMKRKDSFTKEQNLVSSTVVWSALNSIQCNGSRFLCVLLCRWAEQR